MIKVTNLEEKKKILAYFLARQRKTESIEAVFQGKDAIFMNRKKYLCI